MLLQILFYTHHLTTLLFGVFLSAFFLGVNRDWKKNFPMKSIRLLYIFLCC